MSISARPSVSRQRPAPTRTRAPCPGPDPESVFSSSALLARRPACQRLADSGARHGHYEDLHHLATPHFSMSQVPGTASQCGMLTLNSPTIWRLMMSPKMCCCTLSLSRLLIRTDTAYRPAAPNFRPAVRLTIVYGSVVP